MAQAQDFDYMGLYRELEQYASKANHGENVWDKVVSDVAVMSIFLPAVTRAVLDKVMSYRGGEVIVFSLEDDVLDVVMGVSFVALMDYFKARSFGLGLIERINVYPERGFMEIELDFDGDLDALFKGKKKKEAGNGHGKVVKKSFRK